MDGLTVAHVVQGLYRKDEGRVFLRLLYPLALASASASASAAPEEYTYRQVVDRATRWSRHYQERGLAPGAHIVVILQHSLDLYAAYLGALLGGQVPAMFAFPSAKLSLADYGQTIGKLLDNADAELIITYPELKRQLEAILPAAQAQRLSCAPAELPPAQPIVVPGAESSDAGEAVAFLQYSSGTTGLKKGVAITHRALLWQVDAYKRAIALSSRDVILSWLPLYHDMGLICCFFLPILTGTPLIAMSPFDWVQRPVMLLEAASRYRGTLCWLPNFAYNFLAQSVAPSDAETLDLSSLRGIVNCSEPVMAESHERFHQRFSGCGFRLEALAASSTVATLLPAADFSTRNRYPDARRLWDAGVTVALGADCNPGTSYTTSMPFVIALAVRDLRLSPDEALWAATAGGAKALGRDDLGVLRPGAVADLALLDAPSHLHLAYRPGVPLVAAVVKNGAPVRGRWT